MATGASSPRARCTDADGALGDARRSARRQAGSTFLRRQIRAGAVGHFGGHAHALAQRGVRMDGLADVHRIGAHLDGEGDFTDHVTGMRADDAAAQDPAMAVRIG